MKYISNIYLDNIYLFSLFIYLFLAKMYREHVLNGFPKLVEKAETELRLKQWE